MKVRKGYNEKNNKIRNIFIIFFVLSIIILVIYLCKMSYERYKLNNDNVIKDIANDNSQIEKNTKTERMEKLEQLQLKNKDIIAWIQIPDSKINYPVMQTTDNEFYMTHNYKKEKSKDGALFLDKDYDWNLPSTNLLIYGHNNIGSTEMFGDLLKYKDEEFYKTHKMIRFTTNKEDAEYEIISVFKSRVYYKSEKDVFRYYYFINAKNEEEFNYYVENSKKASLYHIEANAKYGDQLLTLSTCSYHTEDGRFVVVARKTN